MKLRLQPRRWLAVFGSALLLSACGSGGHGNANIPGEDDSNAPFAGIDQEEVLRFTGTEPFWGGQVSGMRLTYTTPEDMEGTIITVERFAGRGGLSFSGSLGEKSFDMAVSEGGCSDGMSDRTYPFGVTLRIGDETRSGCAWSRQHPFEEPDDAP